MVLTMLLILDLGSDVAARAAVVAAEITLVVRVVGALLIAGALLAGVHSFLSVRYGHEIEVVRVAVTVAKEVIVCVYAVMLLGDSLACKFDDQHKL